MRCGSHHNIWVYTELYRAGVLIATSKSPYLYFANALTAHDTPTTAIHCGGTAMWQTVSYVVVDGGAWHKVYSPVRTFTPSC